MDTPKNILNQNEPISRNSSLRRRSSFNSNSPEFEFWKVKNPSLPPPDIISADELFSDGFLLPLHLLSLKPTELDQKQPDPEPVSSDSLVDQSGPVYGPELSNESTSTVLSSSKRWKDIFKKTAEKKPPVKSKEEEKEKKREKKSQTGTNNSAELNINIWPFSRSRSAGNNVTRPKMMFGGGSGIRKASSAPCSRSNSAGESKSRKWPSSPGRARVHLGRSSPVWQVRRGGGGGGGGSSGTKHPDGLTTRNSEKTNVSKKEVVTVPRKSRKSEIGEDKNDGKSKVINLNVPTCIGYKSRLSCKNQEISMSSKSSENRSGNSDVGSGGSNNLFGLRNLFAKKVY